jgi:hypothetical protein
MRIISGIIALFCLSVLVVLAGCGGGGGSTPAAPATKATVKLSTQGTLPQGSQLAGIDVLIRLPAGVTVNADANNVVAAGVVTVSGVAAQAQAPLVIYTPGATNGTLRITVVGNFGVGEFLTVNFNLTPGSEPPTASDITISPADQGLNAVNLSVALATTKS